MSTLTDCKMQESRLELDCFSYSLVQRSVQLQEQKRNALANMDGLSFGPNIRLPEVLSQLNIITLLYYITYLWQFYSIIIVLYHLLRTKIITILTINLLHESSNNLKQPYTTTFLRTKYVVPRWIASK